METERLLVGNYVTVRPAREILATLDVSGTLDGLPFMPEMLNWCGKSFRVLRRVDKTCVDGHPMRRFSHNDVVVLEGPRCDGSSHDGCKHGCRIFWKEAWLGPAAPDEKISQISNKGVEELRVRLKTKTDEHRYFCQSTELLSATEAIPDRKRFPRARILFKEIRSGDIGIWQAFSMFAWWLWYNKVLRSIVGDEKLCGPNIKTPTQSLNLQIGERVRVKSRAEIVKTLNKNLHNRGLGVCHEMLRCCGHRAEVRHRVDRLINERTGIMRELADTVALGRMQGSKSLGEECLCYGELGDCPRGELMYWREIWLERASRDP
jgi:hypothetical protein